MAITIGSTSFPTLTAQPFGYEETNTRAGQTARKWLITGLLKPTEWLSLLTTYDTWRNTRINDAPTEASGVIGTTIAFTGKGPGNQTWTSVACWFITAPQAEQSGRYLSASVELVDAAQALAVLLKAKEQGEVSESLPDFGTITIGGVVLTLVKPVSSYAQGPQVQLTASGVHYVTGSLVAVLIKDVEGTTTASGWAQIQSWYESIVATIPAAGSLFPTTPPSASAENKVVNGVTTAVYTVSLQLTRVI
jgi:hypothetical protein